MLAETKKFISLVEVGAPWCENYVVGFHQTESAHPSCMIELGGPGHYLPAYIVLDVFAFQIAHMKCKLRLCVFPVLDVFAFQIAHMKCKLRLCVFPSSYV